MVICCYREACEKYRSINKRVVRLHLLRMPLEGWGGGGAGAKDFFFENVLKKKGRMVTILFT